VHSAIRDGLIPATSGLALLAYLAFLTQHLPMGILRLMFSVAVLLLLGLTAGATMKSELGAKLGLILLVPAIHFAYDGIDPAKASLSVLMYVIEAAVLWVGISVTHFLRRRHKIDAPAA
jgi:hypothetical protein